MEPCDSCLSNEDGLCMAYNAKCEDALGVCFEYHRDCIKRLTKMLDITYRALKSIRFHYNVWSTGHGPDVESTCIVLGQTASKALDKIRE